MQLLYFWRCDMAFTGEERIFCTLQFEAIRSIRTTMRKFTSKIRKKFSSNISIKKWHSNFVNTGNSTTSRKAPPPTVWTPETVAVISEYFEENHRKITASEKCPCALMRRKRIPNHIPIVRWKRGQKSVEPKTAGFLGPRKGGLRPISKPRKMFMDNHEKNTYTKF